MYELKDLLEHSLGELISNKNQIYNRERAQEIPVSSIKPGFSPSVTVSPAQLKPAGPVVPTSTDPSKGTVGPPKPADPKPTAGTTSKDKDNIV